MLPKSARNNSMCDCRCDTILPDKCAWGKVGKINRIISDVGKLVAMLDFCPHCPMSMLLGFLNWTIYAFRETLNNSHAFHSATFPRCCYFWKISENNTMFSLNYTGFCPVIDDEDFSFKHSDSSFAKFPLNQISSVYGAVILRIWQKFFFDNLQTIQNSSELR